jgi:hypothetical protein
MTLLSQVTAMLREFEQNEKMFEAAQDGIGESGLDQSEATGSRSQAVEERFQRLQFMKV